LDTSRLITGNLQLDLAPTEIAPVVKGAIDVVKPAAEGKDIVITCDIGTDVDKITCDPQRLQQMVWNLLTNAVKFTPQGGSIDVSVARRGAMVDIVVKDTGVGITSEFLPFVFDRFRQEDSSSTRSHDGLGLGLAIVRHLAELHGGSVAVYSEGQGKGSTFSISLPLSSAPVSAQLPTLSGPDVSVSAPTVENDLKGIRVLIVDDDKDTCMMLKFALNGWGAEVRTSCSANEAFESVKSWTPHILLSDINMPGEDGYSLLARLRKTNGTSGSRFPAIALTAMARPEDNEKAVAAGFELHMPKPVDIQELTGAIRRLAKAGS
jgi:CheY-like chemotaxis protein